MILDHVLDVGARLPAVRETVAGHLGRRGLGRERVLAAAVRLLDVGCFGSAARPTRPATTPRSDWPRCAASTSRCPTWNGTVLAASLLAEADGTARSRAARTRAVAGVMREVAGHLGNTPAVARSSYVDPRVVDLFHAGTTIPVLREREKTEKAVLELLGA